MAGGVCLFYALFVIQATICFWTIESLELMNTMTYGGVESAQYPLVIYGRWFRGFFTFIIQQGIEALAIVLLHSYRRPEHEARIAALAKTRAPDLYVSFSAEVTPEFREFERTSTTVLNAYIGPRMSRYLARFAEAMGELGIRAAPYTLHSNGGLMSIATASGHPVRTCLSGPAAGVVGAARIAGEAGFRAVMLRSSSRSSAMLRWLARKAGQPAQYKGIIPGQFLAIRFLGTNCQELFDLE